MNAIYMITILVSSSLSQAGVLPQVCMNYVKDPDSFKALETIKVKDKEMLKLQNPFNEIGECEINDSGGSCHTEHSSCFGEYLNMKSDGGYFGFNDVGVEHKGKYYNFLSKKRRMANKAEVIGEVSKKGTTIICDINQQIIDVKSTNESNPICKSIESGSVLKYKIDDSKMVFDLKRDGTKISYSKSGYQSGAGCGCDLDSINAESENPRDKTFIQAINKLNSNEPSCSGKTLPLEWSVIRFKNKDYLFLENPGIKVGTLINAYKHIQTQVVYEWSGDKFSKICSTSYKVKMVATEPTLD